MQAEPASFAALPTLRAELDGADAARALSWADARFGAGLVVASSFGPEDIALLHLVRAHAPQARIITLDTGRLHEETYALMERLRVEWSLPLEVYYPDAASVEALVHDQGLFGFRASIEARRACCHARKVAPLKRALAGAACWVTGMRREQSPTRSTVELLELELAQGKLYKLNPLVDWTRADLDAYTAANQLPIHPLEAQGFPSIGCAPCTRAIQPGEHERAGRWWWERPDDKECGLHPASRDAQTQSQT